MLLQSVAVSYPQLRLERRPGVADGRSAAAEACSTSAAVEARDGRRESHGVAELSEAGEGHGAGGERRQEHVAGEHDLLESWHADTLDLQVAAWSMSCEMRRSGSGVLWLGRHGSMHGKRRAVVGETREHAWRAQGWAGSRGSGGRSGTMMSVAWFRPASQSWSTCTALHACTFPPWRTTALQLCLRVLDHCGVRVACSGPGRDLQSCNRCAVCRWLQGSVAGGAVAVGAAAAVALPVQATGGCSEPEGTAGAWWLWWCCSGICCEERRLRGGAPRHAAGAYAPMQQHAGAPVCDA